MINWQTYNLLNQLTYVLFISKIHIRYLLALQNLDSAYSIKKNTIKRIAIDKPQQLNLYDHEKIIDLAQGCNEITVTIDLKNNETDLNEWDLAINRVKDWRKNLAHTLK